MFTKINFQRLTASYCKSNKLKNIWKSRVGGVWFTDWMRATSSVYVRIYIWCEFPLPRYASITGGDSGIYLHDFTVRQISEKDEVILVSLLL